MSSANHPPNVERDIVVIGGSTGSLAPLQAILAALPRDLAAALFVVTHQAQSNPAHLPRILTDCCPIPARLAVDGEPIEFGHVYVAPPDRHLLIEAGRIKLSRGPKENRFRPSIDPLFRTAARAYGPQVIGVILSGMFDDGTLGCLRVKQQHGVVIAQDPATCDSPDMAACVIRNVKCDHVLKPQDIAQQLTRLVQEPSPQKSHGVPAMTPAQPDDNGKGPPERANVPSETGDTAERGDRALVSGNLPGSPTGLTCPQCGGAVWENDEGGLVTYRCHVGHAYTADNWEAEHNSHLESTLWEAVRMFQERAAMSRRMEEKSRDQGNHDMTKRFKERAEESEARTELMRTLLLGER